MAFHSDAEAKSPKPLWSFLNQDVLLSTSTTGFPKLKVMMPYVGHLIYKFTISFVSFSNFTKVI